MAAAPSRHDRADLRRLAELGCLPVRWRRPAAGLRASRRPVVVVIHETVDTHGLLADLLRGLAMAGQATRLQPTDAGSAEAGLVVRFGEGMTAAAAAPGLAAASTTLLLPAIADLRGNAVSKRAAWSALRDALR